MKKIRLYQNTVFKVGDKVSLEKNNGHHLLKVLRFPVGQTITLFNGDGFDYHAIVIRTKKTCNVEIVSQQKNESESRDRKSTRLNSSHVVISYAVFCLKKKKKSHNCYPPHAT